MPPMMQQRYPEARSAETETPANRHPVIPEKLCCGLGDLPTLGRSSALHIYTIGGDVVVVAFTILVGALDQRLRYRLPPQLLAACSDPEERAMSQHSPRAGCTTSLLKACRMFTSGPG
jgi:hypothetical protein